MEEIIRIVGIDPGLRHTGWGIVGAQSNKLSFIASGTIDTDSAAPLAERLKTLHDGLFQIIKSQLPDEAAVEATFVNRDGAATLKLGQARGICMLVPALAGLTVAEYAPNLVKKSVVGAGHADKVQIRAMVKLLLPRAEFKTEHAADALAIAICHAHHRSMSAVALGARMRMSA
jgi:crossover junction endodeoxyribonuclease RuvC